MFISKWFNPDFESNGVEGELQPVRVHSLPSELTARGSSNDRSQTMARRRRRMPVREPFRSGGWSIRAW